MASTNLPWDLLVDEILCRVPAKHLTRLRSTCKRLNALFDDEVFVERQLARAERQVMYLFLTDSRLHTLSISDGYKASLCELRLEYPTYCNSEAVEICQVFHCNGLLLCSTTKRELVVWNPCSRQTKWIEPGTEGRYHLSDRYALGCHGNNKPFKILRILDLWLNRGFPGRYYGDSEPKLEVEMYEFASNSWRGLEACADDWFVSPSCQGVSLDGNKCYWTAVERQGGQKLFVQSFDFSTERFRRLELPFELRIPHCVHLSNLRGDRLSVSYRRDETYKVETWVTTGAVTDAEGVSWRKLMTVKFAVRWLFNPHFLVHEEEKKTLLFTHLKLKKRGIHLANKTDRVIVFVGGNDDEEEEEEDYELIYEGKARKLAGNGPFLYSYVPSLVRIPDH